MARVVDVAAYILAQRGPMTAMKLQKLVYYSQAWHLVWAGEPLFPNEIEAWANGPVVRELYNQHRGQFGLSGPEAIPAGDPARIDAGEAHTIGVVLDFYGDKSAHWLSELTHAEDPWRLAREEASLHERDRGNAVITNEAMGYYYDGLTQSNSEPV